MLYWRVGSQDPEVHRTWVEAETSDHRSVALLIRDSAMMSLTLVPLSALPLGSKRHGGRIGESTRRQGWADLRASCIAL